LRNFFSFILVSIFGFVFLIGLTTFNLQQTFLNTGNIKRVLAENNVYATLVGDTLPEFLGSLEGEKKGTALFPESLARDLLTKVVEPETLKTDVETTVDQLIPYLKGQQENLDVRIDLTKYKRRLNDNLEGSIVTYIQGLPTCTKAINISQLESLPDCRPRGITPQKMAAQLPLSEVKDSLVKLPDELIIDRSGFKFNHPLNQKELPNPKESEGFDFNNLRLLFRAIHFATLATLALAVVILLFFFLLWWGKVRNASRWVAIALISASILPAVIAGIMLAFLQRSTLERFLRFEQEGSPEFIEGAYSFLGPFFRHFWTLVLYQTLEVILAGIVILVALKLLDKKQAKAT
jgi:hypothetical protein